MSHKNVPRKIGKGIVGDLIRPVSNVELSSIVFLFFVSKLVLGILGLGQTWEFFSFEEEWAKTGQMSNYYIQPASRPIFNRELQQALTQALHYYTTLLLNGNTWKEMLMGFSPDGTYPFSHLSLIFWINSPIYCVIGLENNPNPPSPCQFQTQTQGKRENYNKYFFF